MGILIIAAITTVAALAGYGYLIFRLSAPADRWPLLIAALVALPLQPLAFYLLRLPTDRAIAFLIGRGDVYSFANTFYAPLTEEPAKWLVLAVPAVWAALTPRNAPVMSLAVGLGFGVGEIWFLAFQLLQVGALAGLPFWMFGGFLVERLAVVFLHGAFIALFFQAMAERRNPVPAALAGMAMHYLVNFPIYLASFGAFGLPVEKWQIVAQLVLLAMTVALAFMIARLVQRWPAGA